MNRENTYTVIIPAFNEEKAIEETLSEIKKLPVLSEIIVVDDASTDKTFELASQYPDIKVIRHQSNRGYGAALKTGIENASGEHIVITDADGTYPNTEIPELIHIFEHEKADMLVGARTKKGVKIPLIRRPAKWVITRLASFLAGVNIPDLNSGLRIMKKPEVEKYIRLLPDGFSFTSTITMAMLTNRKRVVYQPIDYFERSGKSKIRPVHDTLNFINLIVRMTLYFEPLKVFLPISLFLILAGFCLILFQAVAYQNISTISVIISLAGIQLLAIGMIADIIDKRLL